MNSSLILTSTRDMSNRDWLNFRNRGLGASDVPSVLNFCEYTSVMQKFDEKTKINSKPKFENFAMFLGKRAENINAEMWEYWDGSIEGMMKNYYSGIKMRKCRKINAYVQNPKYPWLFVSLDRVINKHVWKGIAYEEGALELKNLSSYEAQKWVGGIPLKHLLQVQTQMIVCEMEYGELAIKLDDRDYIVYQFERSDSICEQIINQTHDFWQRVEKGRKIQTQLYNARMNFNMRLVEELEAEFQSLEPEPDGSDALSEYLTDKYKEGSGTERKGSILELDLARSHAEKKKELKELSTNVQSIENKLKNSMKHAEILDFGKDGKVYWSNTKAGSRVFRNKLI